MVKTDRFEAVLMADVRVKDAGVGYQMQLIFEDKTILRVRASPAVLRMRLSSTGLHRATLSLRTRVNGTVREPMYLTQIEPIDTPIQTASRTAWSVRGLVATDPQTIVVFPARTSLSPFRVRFRSGLIPDVEMETGLSVVAQGVLANNVIRMMSIEKTETFELSERELRWKRWFTEHPTVLR